MRLYSGTAQEFVDDTIHNRIADKLQSAYEEYYGCGVGRSEVSAWRNSLQFAKNLIEINNLLDTMVILEYELPYTSERIDCILLGTGSDFSENVVVIELKQWSSVEDCDIENNVITFVGGAKRMVPHPALQVRGYHYLLKDFIQVFNDALPMNLSSCVYCHNYSRQKNDILLSSHFEAIFKNFPVFTKEDFQSLGEYLKVRLAKGKGLNLFNRFISSSICPSKRLVDHAREMINGQKAFTLIDDQIAANNAILDRAKKCAKLKTKSVIIVKGGPGTGKSVIALNAVAELLGKGFSVFHATGSAAFTTTLRKIVGTRAANLFKYFNSFRNFTQNEIDVLVCDEAHRVRETSNGRFTRREHRSLRPQIEELIVAAKLSIFFVDEDQIVRPDEVGSTSLIKETAKRMGINDSETFEFELRTQFRCSGSDGYLNWVDNTLGIRHTANVILTNNEKMEFKIFNSPQKLYKAIKEKNSENPNSARLVAGFCWPWSNPNSDGTLKSDVVIGEFQMPWEGKPGYRLAADIPPAPLWAYDPKGVNQIGCIYTIQGFEFDYVGVIFARDLLYDPARKKWIGESRSSCDPKFSFNKTDFPKYVKNVYRTLLTRGMKGCYVYFLDKNTESYFRSRIEKYRELKLSDILEDKESVSIDKILADIDEDAKFKEYLPVHSLEAVATSFGKEEFVEQLGWMKINTPMRLNTDMFIAKVVGKSMEPTIPDGSYCVFRFEKGGSRNGLVVLVESRLVSDPETNQRFTIKRYKSKKEYFKDGTWQHKKIILSPDNIDFEDITLESVSEGDFKIVAEFVCVVS